MAKTIHTEIQAVEINAAQLAEVIGGCPGGNCAAAGGGCPGGDCGQQAAAPQQRAGLFGGFFRRRFGGGQ